MARGSQVSPPCYKSVKSFPSEEKFALKTQLKRAAVSVTSNIAEGFGRKLPRDKEHFYVMSRGSLDEVRNQIRIARDLKYINDKQFRVIENQAITVAKLLSGLLRAHKNF